MTAGSTTMSEVGDTGAPRDALRVLGAALLASLAAGATGIALVLGRGAIELPGFIAIGLAYALVPGVVVLLVLHLFLSARPVSAVLGQNVYTLGGALGAALWFVPFMGFYMPLDRPDAPAALGLMVLYHAASGAVGGLLFWFLTRRRP